MGQDWQQLKRKSFLCNGSEAAKLQNTLQKRKYKTRIITFIDEKVMTLDKVIGGGATSVLLGINPAEIERFANSEIKDISE